MRASRSRCGRAAPAPVSPTRSAPSSGRRATRLAPEPSTALVHVVAIRAGLVANRTLIVGGPLVYMTAGDGAERPQARKRVLPVAVRYRQEQRARQHHGDGPGSSDLAPSAPTACTLGTRAGHVPPFRDYKTRHDRLSRGRAHDS